MRMAAIALALLAGCNSIFGLSTTYPVDALDAPPGPPPHGAISWMQLESHPVDTILFPAITGVHVQVGPLGAPLADVTWDADGIGFDMPYHTTDGAYRIVYDVPGDPVEHELQWDIPTAVRLAVPLYGRLERTPLPDQSGYSLAPVFQGGTTDDAWPCQSSSPCAGQRTPLTAFTTGTWMQAPASYNPNSTSHRIGVRSQDFVPFSGSTDIPQLATGDELVLVHYDSVGASDAYIATVPPPLAASTYAMQDVSIAAKPGATATWTSEAPAAMVLFQPLTVAQDMPLMNALGGLYSVAGATTTTEIDGGIIPDLAMPSITLASYSGAPTNGVFLTMYKNPDTSSADCFQFADPFTAIDQEGGELRPQGIWYRQYRTRTLAGVTLASGYQMITLSTTDPGCGRPTHPSVAFSVGIAENVTFGMPLTGDGTAVTVPTNGFQDLTFSLSDGGAGTSDCTVTLYRVDAALVPLRTFTVLAKASNMTVKVPTDSLMNGKTFAFGITCRDQYPLAKMGDYSHFGGYPQQESQIFPGTFVVTLQ